MAHDLKRVMALGMLPSSAARSPGLLKSVLQLGTGNGPITLQNGAFWSQFFGTSSSSGECVTVDKALQLSTVWACVRLISETVATLPLGFFERGEDDSRIAAKAHPLYNLLHNQPNADMTAVEFWEAVLSHLLLWGNGYIEPRRIGARLVSLDLLLPDRMSVKRLPDGSMQYRYRDLDGTVRIIPEADVMHIRGFGTNGVMGLSPLGYAREVFGSAIAQDKASAAVFANGMRFSGVFEMDSMVKEDQRKGFQARLDEYRGAMNAGKAPLLELGIRYKPITIPPADAQMIESRSFSIEEICRWYRVPPFMVGHTSSSTSWGTGIEQQMIGFLMFALRPWLTRIEQSIRRCLLTPAERSRYFAEFNIEGLLRGDSAARAAWLSTMAQNGFITRNEGRSKENLPKVDGGDALTVQSNLVPLQQLGKADSGTEAKNALKRWLGVDSEGEPEK